VTHDPEHLLRELNASVRLFGLKETTSLGRTLRNRSALDRRSVPATLFVERGSSAHEMAIRLDEELRGADKRLGDSGNRRRFGSDALNE
jgi:hypothetical protein